MILVENPLSGELVLSLFDRVIREEVEKANSDIFLMCGLNFEVGCLGWLRVDSDGNEALA